MRSQDVKQLSRILLIHGTGRHENLVRVVKEAAQHVRAAVTVPSESAFDIALTSSLRDVIAESDLVIADVSERNSNVLYEVGLAHGLGKPVLLLNSSEMGSLPFDLLGQLILQYSNSEFGLKALAYQMTELLEDGKVLALFPELLYGPSKGRAEPRKYEVPLLSPRFASIVEMESPARAVALESWIKELLSGVPGWSIVSDGSVTGDWYDAVIWNSSEDPALAALGDLIVAEVKATQRIVRGSFRKTCERARELNLRSLLFVSSAESTNAIKDLVQQFYTQWGFLVIVIDAPALNMTNTSEDFAVAVRSALRRIHFGES